MSHDTGHGHSTENKTIISFKNAFWLVIILVLLFISALNFVSAEGGNEGEGQEKVEQTAAPANEKPASEMKTEAPKQMNETPAAEPAATDTAKAH